jgi:hypothetical protein
MATKSSGEIQATGHLLNLASVFLPLIWVGAWIAFRTRGALR